MKNEIIKDKNGLASDMATFTAAELAEKLGKDHPVLKVNGKPIDSISIGRFEASEVEGVPCSVRNGIPMTCINFDDAVKACEAKGEGWHLMTAAEWGAVALLSKLNGTLPHGNNNAGCDYAHRDETGKHYINDGGKVLTGSGPATWSHDHTERGIYGLNGNVLEWIGGVRFLDGELQVIPDNDAAGGADQSRGSKAWQPVLVDGEPLRYKVDSGSITVTTDEIEDPDWTASASTS